MLCVSAEARTGAASAAGFALTPPSLLRAGPEERNQRVRLVCSRRGNCLGLTFFASWREPALTNLAGVSAVPPTATVPAARPARALPAASVPGMGKRFALKEGRVLSLQLTPTPVRCAPLFEISY
jgi:hypothetical protein